jgi:hypothetical protein
VEGVNPKYKHTARKQAVCNDSILFTVTQQDQKTPDMRSLSLVLFTVATLTICCKKSNTSNPNDVCGVKNPLSDLPWLKQKIDDLRAESLSGQVRRYRYNGEDVISIQAWIQSCYPCTLYTCSGRVLTQNDNPDVIQAVMNNLDELVVIGEF